MIATKASRMVRAAKEKPLWEFGARRAHGVDAAIEGARAAYLAGFAGTSCVAAQQAYDIPVMERWVTPLSNSSQANMLRSAHGVSTARSVQRFWWIPMTLVRAVCARDPCFPRSAVAARHYRICVRLDSGDLAALSKETRHMLDEAGLSTCRIFASNALDEYRIQTLEKQGAAIEAMALANVLLRQSKSRYWDAS